MKKTYIPSRERGAALITAVIFFVVISVTMAVGLSSPVVREYMNARDFDKSKGAFYLAEAGQEDVFYRIRKGLTLGAEEVISLNGSNATTTITTVDPANKIISTIADILRNTRRVKSGITTGSGESFTYGVWVGDGGILLSNNSSITGNLFASGPVCGGGSTGATCSTGGTGTNVITGTIISHGTTGVNGVVSRIQNQGGASMYGGTIKNSTISGSAYCNTISGSSTSTCQTLPALEAAPLPITAEEIANFESIAAAGGTATCSGGLYRITTSVTIGPKKIPCKLKIETNNITVTFAGHVWVTGDIAIEGTINLRVDPSLSGQSIVLIADNPSNQTTSSKIELENSVTVAGAPGGNSWLMLLSENKGASLGLGGEEAIVVKNNAAGDLLLYSRLGDILLENNASVKEVTGYQITLKNNANIVYTLGLQNVLFTSGPGGSWAIDGWKEGQ
ncbi:MAG: hypothetical protein WAZ40_02620 [Minisyncoccia bacterium]